MKLIIAGSRTGFSYEEVCRAIDEAMERWNHPTITEVISGAAVGVDLHGEVWATRHGFPVKRFMADWANFGRSAGPRRNQEMAAYGDALVAVWDGKSRGTLNMIKIAKSFGRKIHVFSKACSPTFQV